MEGVVLESKRKGEKPQPAQRSRNHSPNVIGNAEDQHKSVTFGLNKINFAAFGVGEERKAADPSSELKKVTMSQFTRNVHSKQDLLFAFQVKGKYTRTS